MKEIIDDIDRKKVKSSIIETLSYFSRKSLVAYLYLIAEYYTKIEEGEQSI